jgi:hypothetical protein
MYAFEPLVLLPPHPTRSGVMKSVRPTLVYRIQFAPWLQDGRRVDRAWWNAIGPSVMWKAVSYESR